MKILQSPGEDAACGQLTDGSRSEIMRGEVGKAALTREQAKTLLLDTLGVDLHGLAPTLYSGPGKACTSEEC